MRWKGTCGDRDGFMTLAIGFVLVLCVVVFLLLAFEVFPPDVVAMMTLVVVTLTGLLTPKEAFAGFASEGPITVAAMFVLSAALQRAGAITAMARWLARLPAVGLGPLLLILMPVVGITSALVNNTPVVVALMPVMFGLAQQQNLPCSKLLIPLSYGAILGGTCTLIGTSTNLVVSSIAAERYGIHFSLFQISGIGVLLLIVGTAYMATIGRMLLPDRETLSSLIGSSNAREFVTEVVIRAGSSLIGQTVGQTPLVKLGKARPQAVIRDNNMVGEPPRKTVLQAGDIVQLTAPADDVLELHDMVGAAGDAAERGLAFLKSEETVVIEVVVTNNSRLAGRSLEDLRFFERFRAAVLAIHRRGENLRDNLQQVELRFGDTLLLKLPKERLADFRENRDLLALSDSVIVPLRREKMPIVLVVLGLVVGLATFGVYPISVLALSGVVLLVATRCLRVSEIYESIDWRIVMMIIGMLGLGAAMEKTGAAAYLANLVIDTVRGGNPIFVLAAFYLLTTVLTEVISNNAVAVIFTPIAYQTAIGLGLDPVPFLVAVMFGASASFATPIGYQTNTFVFSAGGYRFMDFLRVGLPLNGVALVTVTFLIPLFFPLVAGE